MKGSEAIFSVTRMLSQADYQISKSRTEKIIFALAVFISCLMLGYLVYKATDGYVDSPTTIELSSKELDEFPKVSLSLRNIINGSKVESVGLTKLHIKHLLGQAHHPFWILTDEDHLELDKSNITTLGKDINEVCKAHNFTRPELLEYVKYEWGDLVGILPDLSTDERARMEYRGKLLRLTMIKEYNDSQTIRARLPVLTFWLKDLAEEAPYIENNAIFGTSAVVDFENPDNYDATNAVGITPKISTNVFLVPELFNVLSRLNSQCRQSDGSYSRCNTQCWLKVTECELDCKWWSEELEDLMEEKVCRSRWLFELRNQSCYQLYDNCTARCSVPPCQYWQYSTYFYPPSVKSLNRTEVTVNLRWGWRAIVHENKYTMSLIDWASNVAGLVGMFFGGSVTTIICFCCSWFMKTWVQEIGEHQRNDIPQKQDSHDPDAGTPI